VRGKRLAVLGGGVPGLTRALLLRAWSDDVTLLADGPVDLDAEGAARLEAAGVAVDERPVAELRGPGDALREVVFADGTMRRCEGLMVPAPMHQRSDLAARLGATFEARGEMTPDAIVADAMGATAVPGLLAAGDLVERMPSVARAIAGGHSAAAMIVHQLAVDPR
jgi:thioredoxin reductase